MPPPFFFIFIVGFFGAWFWWLRAYLEFLRRYDAFRFPNRPQRQPSIAEALGLMGRYQSFTLPWRRQADPAVEETRLRARRRYILVLSGTLLFLWGVLPLIWPLLKAMRLL